MDPFEVYPGFFGG